jgi:hypothetical protein
LYRRRYFLGDFWHARGAIPVEPLIDALNAVREWTQPAVMIPGNHDQVTAGGEIHALSPLAAANPEYIRVLSRPTAWRGALWLPYRRDPVALRDAVAEAKRLAAGGAPADAAEEAAAVEAAAASEAAVEAAVASEAAAGETAAAGEAATAEAAAAGEAAGEAGASPGVRLDAIFCHADVVGASMNDSFQAKDGLDPNLFAVQTGGGGGGGSGGAVQLSHAVVSKRESAARFQPLSL